MTTIPKDWWRYLPVAVWRAVSGCSPDNIRIRVSSRGRVFIRILRADLSFGMFVPGVGHLGESLHGTEYRQRQWRVYERRPAVAAAAAG